jgi:hypothetical protein
VADSDPPRAVEFFLSSAALSVRRLSCPEPELLVLDEFAAAAGTSRLKILPFFSSFSGARGMLMILVTRAKAFRFGNFNRREIWSLFGRNLMMNGCQRLILLTMRARSLPKWSLFFFPSLLSVSNVKRGSLYRRVQSLHPAAILAFCLP